MRRVAFLLRAYIMRILTLFFIGTTFLLLACNKQSPAPSGQNISYLNVHYQPDTTQIMDVYVPGTTKRTIVPVFLLVHGGGWFAGDKTDFNGADIYNLLMGYGYAVVNMNYRLAPKYIYPAPLDDVDSVIAFLQTKSAVWGIDPTHICMVGRSSGGQIALMYAYTRNHAGRIKAVADFFGITDLTALQDMAVRLDTQIANYMGVAYLNNESLWHNASPLYHMDGAIPTAIFHGSADQTVYPTQSQWLRDSLQQRGIPYYYLSLPGVDHYFDSSTFQSTMSTTANWVDTYVF
jgi:acetyl esterase/lipase